MGCLLPLFSKSDCQQGHCVCLPCMHSRALGALCVQTTFQQSSTLHGSPCSCRLTSGRRWARSARLVMVMQTAAALHNGAAAAAACATDAMGCQLAQMHALRV